MEIIYCDRCGNEINEDEFFVCINKLADEYEGAVVRVSYHLECYKKETKL
jgi:hypothetical protein